MSDYEKLRMWRDQIPPSYAYGFDAFQRAVEILKPCKMLVGDLDLQYRARIATRLPNNKADKMAKFEKALWSEFNRLWPDDPEAQACLVRLAQELLEFIKDGPGTILFADHLSIGEIMGHIVGDGKTSPLGYTPEMLGEFLRMIGADYRDLTQITAEQEPRITTCLKDADENLLMWYRWFYHWCGGFSKILRPGYVPAYYACKLDREIKSKGKVLYRVNVAPKVVVGLTVETITSTETERSKRFEAGAGLRKVTHSKFLAPRELVAEVASYQGKNEPEQIQAYRRHAKEMLLIRGFAELAEIDHRSMAAAEAVLEFWGCDTLLRADWVV